EQDVGVAGGTLGRLVVQRHDRHMLSRRALAGERGAHLVGRAIEDIATSDSRPDSPRGAVGAYHFAAVDRDGAIGDTLKDEVGVALLPGEPRKIALARPLGRALAFFGQRLSLLGLLKLL